MTFDNRLKEAQTVLGAGIEVALAYVRGEIAVIAELPSCDLCDEIARYDGMIASSIALHGEAVGWAYMCETHYKIHGRGLGEGIGQRLVLYVPPFEIDGFYVTNVFGNVVHIEPCDWEDTRERDAVWVDLYNAYDPAYNIYDTREQS